MPGQKAKRLLESDMIAVERFPASLAAQGAENSVVRARIDEHTKPEAAIVLEGGRDHVLRR